MESMFSLDLLTDVCTALQRIWLSPLILQPVPTVQFQVKKSHNCIVRPVSIMPDPKWGPIILLSSKIILAIHFCRSHIRPSGPSTGNMDHHPSWLHTSRFLQSILLQENNYWQEEGAHSAHRVTVNWSLFYPHSVLHSFRSGRLQSYWYSISSNCLHCQE